MAIKNPIGKIKDAAFSTLKHPLGLAGKAAGTVGRLTAPRRLPPTRPAPRPVAETLPPEVDTSRPAAAKGKPAPKAAPEVEATPADVAAVVEKKAPARKAPNRKPAARKSAPKASPATPGAKPATKRPTTGPGAKLPFPPREPEGDPGAPQQASRG